MRQKEIYSVRVKWILLLEIVQVEYFFDKFIVNFHAVLLILHVFQVDMIYMYHNSGVVYKCSQLTTFGDLFRNGTPHHFSGRQTGPILIFFLFRCLVQSVCFIWNAKIKKTPYVNNFIGCFQSFVCVSFQISGITCRLPVLEQPKSHRKFQIHVHVRIFGNNFDVPFVPL